MSEYILEMKDITKEFPGVKALSDVNFSVKQGEIHALVGENGAGKSTLMKVLSGVYPHGTYSGDIILRGSNQQYANIKESEHAGIAIIYQELALVKQMSICENIFLGNEVAKRGIINWDEANNRTIELLKRVRLKESPQEKIVNLGVGKQQLVEIAKAMSKKAEILILDEPTAALTDAESAHLLSILRELKNQGVTCVYISHKLNEVMNIADTITILRDGKTICTKPASEMSEDKIISHMVGREMTERFPRTEQFPGEVVLEVKNWTVYNPELPDKKTIDNASFAIKKGEILGIAGLMGAGRTELFQSLIGAYGVNISGEIFLEGKAVKIKSPLEAIESGISYLSEDRKRFGLILMQDIRFNISLPSLRALSKAMVINENEEIVQVDKYVKDLHVKTPSIEQLAGNLSGGNQQKVVLAKWLMTNPKVLILDEPTRGIDVGAKFEIYTIMNELIEKGVAIVMISSELPELLGMSNRVIVVSDGKITGELDWKEATQEVVMQYATGGNLQ